jgi:hypothetical protein
MRTHTFQLVVAALILTLNQQFGIIGVRYLRLVDNDPLPNAATVVATVVAIEGDSIKLADGRAIKIEREADSEFRNRIHKSANQLASKRLVQAIALCTSENPVSSVAWGCR